MRRIWLILATVLFCAVLVSCERLSSRFTWRDQSRSPWHKEGVEAATGPEINTGATSGGPFSSDREALNACLPKDVLMDTVVGTIAGGKTITVENRLLELHAYASGDGKLHDGNGTEICFYRHKTGALGKPPNGVDRVAWQTEDIEELKKHYIVIELTDIPARLPD